MNRRLLSLAILICLGATGTLTGTAKADETATIRNESSHVIPMVLKWTSRPDDSGLIFLAPGQNYTTRGPDGQTLFVRFNGTPGNSQFPRWVDLRVITQFTNNLLDPGVISVFRNVNPFDVFLVLP